MKTKLLKKVRKRFEIIRYDEINDTGYWLHGRECPLWVLRDNHDEFEIYGDSYDEMYVSLRMRIRDKYATPKQKKDKYEKLWW